MKEKLREVVTVPGMKRRALVGIVAAFFLCGALRLLLYRVDFASSFSTLFSGIVTLSWSISVRKRVTDSRLRRILLCIVATLLLFLCLQICRFTFFSSFFDVQRYLWYAYYLPLAALPVLCLSLALLICRTEERPLPWTFWLTAGVMTLLALGVMTNDLHFWAKSFPTGVMTDDGREKSGWLYYLISAGGCSIYITAFGIILRKSHRYTGQGYRWLPAVPLLAASAYFLLYPLNLGGGWFGHRLWTIGDIQVFCLIASLESCIQTGMIPANTGYDELFTLMELPAVIVDSAGNVRFRSAGAADPLPQRPHVQTMTHPIHGGQVEWKVDVEPLITLNRELEAATQQIETRNAYLAAQAKIRAERAELETRNRIYDDIRHAVRAQLDRINSLLEDHDSPFDQRLRTISVLSAYIKRRSNMELLSGDGYLGARELYLAVNESLTYLRLSGVQAVALAEGVHRLHAGMVIAAYAQIERVIEASLGTLSRLVIYLQSETGALTVRMMLQTSALTEADFLDEAPTKGFSRTTTFSAQGPDVQLAFLFREGGDGS